MVERCFRPVLSLSRIARTAGFIKRFAANRQHQRRGRVSAAIAALDSNPINEIPLEASTSPPLSSHQSRREAIRNAKPFSAFLTDTFQRRHDYLRISITEKCNLRCLYCMPEEGVLQSPPPDLLTTPEIFLLSQVFVSQGVTKIRLTGGEPTVRRDILPLMHQIGSLRSQGLKELCLTTNGISLHRKLDSMVEAGLTGVNLSLDTLDPWQFQIMTRRKGFEAVIKSIEQILEMNKLGAGIKLKINCVVMRGMNEKEIIPFLELGREKDLEVRFIEYMPFDGNKWSNKKMLGYSEMLDMIRAKYPDVRKVQDHKNDTSKTYEIPGFVGKMGFITSMTNNFCGGCNRLRITSDGNLKVCLFGNAEVSLRDILRETNNGEPIDEQAFEAMKQLESTGQQGLRGTKPALGTLENEQRLLEVIGLAVGRKKEKHAGMGELENMKNRPMILIDHAQSNHVTYDHVMPLFSSLTCRKIRPISWESKPIYLPSSKASKASIDLCRLFSTTITSRSKSVSNADPKSVETTPKLTHLNSSSAVHMVPISSKEVTTRIAVAVCYVCFSDSLAVKLIQENGMKKGDVLGVARVAGIMAAKKTSELIPLCHPIAITHVEVEVEIARDEDIGAQTKEEERMEKNVSLVGTGQGDVYVKKWSSSSPSGIEDLETASSVPADKAMKEDKGKHRINITATVSCDGKTGVEMEALTAASMAALTVYDMCKAVDKGIRIDGLRVVRKDGGRTGTWMEGVNVKD